MKKTSLLATNSYLKDPRVRDRLLRRTVISSSAVEGAQTAAAKALDVSRKNSFATPAAQSGLNRCK
ncbi:hypothetical protein SAMN02745124_02445 [Desulfofustis glycolicus DSM 9705]|uniref:Uncharacterized protein n=1 Tax=Desulfofustis glycolicus DSM 9705 TaxID=1121409 RepID=A0A1M5WQ83_9BACT|nr:hypothetical protein SAMN02745124_02445 [Desulfofustis glycolicus DSM 9705]